MWGTAYTKFHLVLVTTKNCDQSTNVSRQAGAELCEAQLKMRMGLAKPSLVSWEP